MRLIRATLTRLTDVRLLLLAASSVVAFGQGACGQGALPSGNGGPGNGGQGGEDAGSGAATSTGPGNGGQGGYDAGAPTVVDAGGTSTVDAGSPPLDAASPVDSGPPVQECASNASISSILSQYGSDQTDSNVTPMGQRFETAAQALPISSQNVTFLGTASSNPDPSVATSATGLAWKTVQVSLYPSGTPSPEDIMQHDIGDCDGDSALASMAYVNPTFVQTLIKDNGDGTFNIAMFDPMGKPITVVVDSEILWDTGGDYPGEVSAADGQTADWATILEKAVMKYDYAYNMVGQLDGIGSETLVPMFTGTGGSVAISPGQLTPQQFQQVVTVSLAAGKFITGGFSEEGLTIGQDSTVTAHGYAVMVPTDPTADMTDMRNPWGVNPWASGSNQNGYDTSTDGLLQIPLATSPENWPQIIDLRIIDPGPQCTGATAPFMPQYRSNATPIHIHETHGKDTKPSPHSKRRTERK